MSWLDWTIAAVVLFAALQGFRRGLLIALVGAAGVIAGYLAASYWYRPLGEVVRRSVRLSESWAAGLSFVVLLLAVYALIGLAITIMAGAERLPPVSRLLGAAAGAVKGALLAIVLLVAAMASPIGDPIRTDAETSSIAFYAIQAHKMGAAALDAVLPDAIRPFGLEDARF